MKKYFAPLEIEKRFNRCSKRTQKIAVAIARNRAEQNQSRLDMQSNLFAIFNRDIDEAIKLNKKWKPEKL